MPSVVHLSSVHPPFDTRIFINECRSLAQHGYDVSLIIVHDKDERIDNIALQHIKKKQTGRIRRMVFTTWQVYKKAKKAKADLYHFHDAELIPIAILLRLGGAKIIYDIHEDLPLQIQSKHYLHPVFKFPLALLAKTAEWISTRIFFTGIVAATPDIARRFAMDKTIIVQNFPRLEEIIDTKSNILHTNQENNICYIGGISKERGIFEIVKSMALLKTSQTKLLLAGSFFSSQIQQKITSENGWENVNYLGHINRTQVIEQLNKSRCGLVILHPTKAYLTSYPVKMFEYMAAGLPIIASNFSLWQEILNPFDCAIFVDPTDTNEISKAIDWILQNPDKAYEMGQRGKKAAEQYFNWKNEEEKLLRLYEKLLA